MKKITILFATLLVLFTSLVAIAMNDDGITITLTELKQDPPIYADEPGQPHRSCPSLVLCTMTTKSISISGIDISEVYSFDVLNSDGLLIAKFSTESDFLDFIFSNRGYFEIRLLSAQYTLSGWIEICQ